MFPTNAPACSLLSLDVVEHHPTPVTAVSFRTRSGGSVAPIVLLYCDTSATQRMDQPCCRQLPATSRCVLLLLLFDDVAVEGVTAAAAIAAAASSCLLKLLWL